MGAVLEVRGVTKRFGAVVANDGVDVSVRAGEIVGLLGHNGAGKTTLVSQVVGLLRPDAGSIEVAGTDAVAHPALARRAVSLQSQGQAPLDGLTPRHAIEYAGRLRGLSPRDARAAAERVGEELDIGEWLDRRALPDGGGISGGVRRLTAFAMAIVAPTPVVVLDEPTNDVDAARRRLLWQAVRRLGERGAGVLLVTHNVVEAERVVDELVLLDQGRVVAAGTPARLHGADHDLRLELTLHPDGDDPSDTSDMPVTMLRRVRAGRRVLLTLPAAEARHAVAWAAGLRDGDRVESYSLTPATLEDAYLALTGPQHDLESADV
ncbi:MAG TPA: ABC transporter ATP-binding protein [Egicoccus sp.]|nr:ABC transporter ATP-binding protein [Egicoccus sp.]HSK24739.1 ABC transporter ATP-binding protein [Egicoccus sp.]